jgi:hypothetical protein
MLLATNQRNKPLGDSVSEIEHSLKSLKFNTNTAFEAGSDKHKSPSLGNLPASCQPAKPASLRFWQAHLKPAAPHGQRLAIAYDKVKRYCIHNLSAFNCVGREHFSQLEALQLSHMWVHSLHCMHCML